MDRTIQSFFFLLLLISALLACTEVEQKPPTTKVIDLTLEQAERLAQLPLKCIQNPLPYKSGIVLADSGDLAMPQAHHPAFYGCFDWHSAVHGHWSLVYLLKNFPELTAAEEIRKQIGQNLTPANIQKEIDYFSLNKYTKSFERTYGWAWLLKLSEELYTWEDPDGQKWYEALVPLNEIISQKYIDYLPKLVYPIRVGEHTNTAFGLTFAHDYASTVGEEALKEMIEKRARDFYYSDQDCPLTWEPSGYDFLSPCLEEMDIMRRVLGREEFFQWQSQFLPDLQTGRVSLQPAEVIDRSDGKLVHLDGLNFSRAWCLFPLSRHNEPLRQLADQHLQYSFDKITDGDYSGEHWLASFALYALKSKLESH